MRPAVVIVPGHPQRAWRRPIALSPSQKRPRIPRPWVRVAPGIDDATRLGIIEADPIIQRHPLQRADGAAEAECQQAYLADLRVPSSLSRSDPCAGCQRRRSCRCPAASGRRRWRGKCRAPARRRARRRARAWFRASTIEKSDHTNTFRGLATSAGRTVSASLRATGMSTGLRCGQRGVVAAVGDQVDQRSFVAAVVADDVAY